MSKITPESIIEKLGFDPRLRNNEWYEKHYPNVWLIDDRPSPYSVLTFEELEYLIYVMDPKEEILKRNKQK